MDRALFRLLLLRLRGGIRNRLRQLISFRGMAFMLVIVSVGWFVLRMASSIPAEELGGVALDDADAVRERIQTYLPLGLFGAWLFNIFAATGPAFNFSQNEIDFLFAGPFSRRSLLVYKCCIFLGGLILTAGVLVLLIPPKASWPPAAFFAALLTPMFIQMSGAAVRILGQTYGAKWQERLQTAVTPVLLVVAAAVLFVTATTEVGALDALTLFRQSWFGSILLAPFHVFSELFLARKFFPDLFMWVLPAIAINVVLILVIFAFDNRTAEASLSESLRSAKRWARVRRGGSILASDRSAARSRRRSPSIGGIGPIVWRQSISAVRNTGRVFVVFVGAAVVTGPVVASAGNVLQNSTVLGLLYLVIAFIMPRALMCDFRGDFGNIELYKALPIAPWRISAGQIIVPALLASVIEWTMILSTALFFDGAARAALIILMIYVVPANLLLFGIENLVFLLFPTKLVPVGRIDFEFLGRTLFDFTLKTIMFVVAVSVAGSVGIAAFRVSGQSYAWGFGASLLLLVVFTFSMLPMLAIAFRRATVDQTLE